MPATINSFDQLDLTRSYTYLDYLSWTFPERVELFLGQVFKMSPAPNVRHQRISLEISRIFGNHLRQGSCQVFAAPFDVRLPVAKSKDKTDTVVQPDIVVICDQSKLDEQGCNGAPDIVVEILSPGNSRKDMKDKFELYEMSLVPEYWIVDPGNQSVIIYTLNEQKKYFGSKPFVADEIARSTVIKGLEIEVTEIFRE